MSLYRPIERRRAPRPSPYVPPTTPRDAEMNILMSALRMYYDDVKRKHTAAVNRNDHAASRFYATERARTQQLMDRVTAEYLAMRDEEESQ